MSLALAKQRVFGKGVTCNEMPQLPVRGAEVGNASFCPVFTEPRAAFGSTRFAGKGT